MNRIKQNEYEREIKQLQNKLLEKDREINELHKMFLNKCEEIIGLRKKYRKIPLYTMDNYVEKTQGNRNDSESNKASKAS